MKVRKEEAKDEQRARKGKIVLWQQRYRVRREWRRGHDQRQTAMRVTGENQSVMLNRWIL